MLKKIFLNEWVIFAAIIINALIIFLLAFPELKANELLHYIDYGFILFFLLEAIVKMIYLGPKTYFKDGWNRFDFFIVVVSLPSLLAPFIPIPDTSILLLLRLLRLIRLFKFMLFIPHMEQLLAGLIRAFKASVFVLIALFFLNFLLAIFTCTIYGETAPEYFGDPLISAYHIFQMFTVEGWNEIPNQVVKEGDSYFEAGVVRFYFAIVVLLGGIFGMSLANAVFVDEMTIDNNAELEKKIDVLEEKIDKLQEILTQNNS